MTREHIRGALEVAAAAVILGVALIRQEVRLRTNRDRPLATVTNIDSRRTPGEE